MITTLLIKDSNYGDLRTRIFVNTKLAILNNL